MNTSTTVVSSSSKPLVMHWGAVTAGLVVAVVVGMLLNLLGLGLGFIALPLHKSGLTSLSISALVWYILSGSIAMCLGGWTAGFFSHTCKRRESFLYGVITWALATIVGALLSAWGVGALVGGVGSVVATSLKAVSSQSVELVGKPAFQLISENEKAITSTIQEQVNALLESSSKGNGSLINRETGQVAQGVRRETKQILKKLTNNNTRIQFMHEVQKWVKADNQASSDQAKAKVKEFLVKNTDLSDEEVEKVISDWQAYYQNMRKYAQERLEDAKKEATYALERGSTAAGSVALSLFFVMLLGAVASAYGSLMGAKAQCLDSFVDLEKRV